jgi:hypothetical protein
MKNSREGHVYVLTSQNCEYIKIGGTDYAPFKRIKEINTSYPYRKLGPWTLHDFRQVTDWRHVEYHLHYAFRSKAAKLIVGQRELFNVSPVLASKELAGIDESMVVRKPKVDRMFQDQEFSRFLGKLFRFTGIVNWLDLQGAWTFNLFPSTKWGRYYTLNIGPHEVAFTTCESNDQRPWHMLHMDSLILECNDAVRWIKKRAGEIKENNYSLGLYRSASVLFEGNFETALQFLDLPGVRRAIIAYWTEALLGLKERGVLSTYARYHNWNAVAELKKQLASGVL